MPIIEIEEDELKLLRSSKQLLDAMSGQPKTRKPLLKLIKELNPNLVIPELDSSEPLAAKVEEIGHKTAEEIKNLRDELETERREARVNGDISQNRKTLKDNGWDSESISKIEKLMEDRGLADYEAAEALYDRQQPKPEPLQQSAGFGPSRLNIGRPEENDTSHADLLKDPDGWTDREVQKFFAERKTGRGGRAA